MQEKPRKNTNQVKP